jgi:hypothetical protein
MSADRELLELAAKAAGMKPRDQWAYDEEWGLKVSTGTPPYEWWNPHADNDDALRLAMKLAAEGKLRFQVLHDAVTAFQHWDGVWVPITWTFETVDPSEAFRQAIFRAAAEIGRNMP